MANEMQPSKAEDYTPIQAQNSFTKTELTAYKDLSVFIQEHNKKTLEWYWELGSRINKMHKHAKANGELYNEKLLIRMAKALGFSTDRVLYYAMHVVETLKKKSAFNEFVRMRGEAGNSLTWSHLVRLCDIGSDVDRRNLAAAALEQAWSADALGQRVRELCEKKSRGRRGPVARVPTSAKACLTHMCGMAERFVKNTDEAWTSDSFDLEETLGKIPVTQLNDKLLESIRTTRQHLVDLQTRAEKLAEILEDGEATIRERREAQQALEEQQAAEDEDEADEEEAAAAEAAEPIVDLGARQREEARERRAAKRKRTRVST
jgi:hypothetical protein